MSAQRYSIPNTWHGRLHSARETAGLTRRALAGQCGVSERRILHLELEGQGYLTPPERLRYTAALGLTEAHIEDVPGASWVREPRPEGAPAPLPPPTPRRAAGFAPPAEHEEKKMLEKREVLTRSELQTLGLRANPFPDRPSATFIHPALSQVIEACEAAIDDSAMIAVCGPSGSGKSTVLNQLRDSLDRRQDVVAVDLAATDRGKITDWVLETSILEALKVAPKAVPMGAERRTRKVVELLTKRAKAGGRTVLLADDFQDASRDLLRMLRRLREADPRYYLLSVVMAGQEGLAWALQSEELREVGGRTQLVEMPRLGGIGRDKKPLPNLGADFLAWHFRQVGAELGRYFLPEAAAHIAEQAEYPLWARNLAVMALRRTVGTGRPVDVALLGRLARG